MIVELVPGVHRIEAEVFLEEQGLGLRDRGMLLVTHSDLDHQGGAHLLKHANPSLWVTCGVLDIPLISDPEVLIAQCYQAYVELHGIAPHEDGLAWMRQESGGPVRVDLGWTGGKLLELGPDWTVRILHVPGHSAGHLAVYDERSGALFGGGCLRGSVYVGLDGTPKLCPTYTHVEDYLATASQVRRSLTDATSSRGEDGRLVYQEAR
jgi:glyoxylase-like metal-dependent hydrolase (beta-lactamase superfamily II)